MAANLVPLPAATVRHPCAAVAVVCITALTLEAGRRRPTSRLACSKTNEGNLGSGVRYARFFKRETAFHVWLGNLRSRTAKITGSYRNIRGSHAINGRAASSFTPP
ncbi:hypothetical protein PF008_g2307 [Phytophthora fragariae]|uniref:Uncharacterized protein n=1 Tax=Phytophthora fragariae TaxID=53985 RepID=A0A6G0SIN3_9STRA|nr:hypothetical protein PF008_g2307 [Phytophthora fragariae]